jgi:hypothetical protein
MLILKQALAATLTLVLTGCIGDEDSQEQCSSIAVRNFESEQKFTASYSGEESRTLTFTPQDNGLRINVESASKADQTYMVSSDPDTGCLKAEPELTDEIRFIADLSPSTDFVARHYFAIDVSRDGNASSVCENSNVKYQPLARTKCSYTVRYSNGSEIDYSQFNDKNAQPVGLDAKHEGTLVYSLAPVISD